MATAFGYGVRMMNPFTSFFRHLKRIIPAPILAGLISCTGPVNKSLWQTTPVTIDGHAWEWKKPLRFFDSKSKLRYSFSNDRENFYICIRAADQEAQEKMMRGGIQIWIDTNGTTKQVSGLLFPLPDYEHRNDDLPVFNDVLNLVNIPLRTDMRDMEVQGFKTISSGIVSKDAAGGLVVDLNRDSLDVMTWELKLPFRYFYRDHLSPSDSTKTWGLTLILDGLPLPGKTGVNLMDADSMNGKKHNSKGMTALHDKGIDRKTMDLASPLLEPYTLKIRFNPAWSGRSK